MTIADPDSSKSIRYDIAQNSTTFDFYHDKLKIYLSLMYSNKLPNKKNAKKNSKKISAHQKTKISRKNLSNFVIIIIKKSIENITFSSLPDSSFNSSHPHGWLRINKNVEIKFREQILTIRWLQYSTELYNLYLLYGDNITIRCGFFFLFDRDEIRRYHLLFIFHYYFFNKNFDFDIEWAKTRKRDVE